MRKKNMDWLPLTRTPTGDWTCNPGMCPDWELNLRLFGLPDNAQWAHTGQGNVASSMKMLGDKNKTFAIAFML